MTYLPSSSARAALLGLALALFTAPTGFGQDFVECAASVEPGEFRIEVSGVFERTRMEGVESRVNTTPMLLEYGIFNGWEIRIETDAHYRVRETEMHTGEHWEADGLSDISPGVKWTALEGSSEKGIPAVGFLLHADLPSGDKEVRGKGVRPSLRVVSEWELPSDFVLTAMPGVLYDNDGEGNRYVSGMFGVALAHAWPHDFETFVEVSWDGIMSNRYGDTVMMYASGIAFFPKERWQLDTVYAWGGNKYSPDHVWALKAATWF